MKLQLTIFIEDIVGSYLLIFSELNQARLNFEIKCLTGNIQLLSISMVYHEDNVLPLVPYSIALVYSFVIPKRYASFWAWLYGLSFKSFKILNDGFFFKDFKDGDDYSGLRSAKQNSHLNVKQPSSFYWWEKNVFYLGLQCTVVGGGDKIHLVILLYWYKIGIFHILIGIKTFFLYFFALKSWKLLKFIFS